MLDLPIALYSVIKSKVKHKKETLNMCLYCTSETPRNMKMIESQEELKEKNVKTIISEREVYNPH